MKTKQFIDSNYLYISPTGDQVPGFDGFSVWCNKVNLPIEKTAFEYVETLKKYYRLSKNGLIDGTKKIKNTFTEIGLSKLYYLDFYAIERFGKTKHQLTKYYDESGDHNLQKSKMDPQFPLFVLTGVVIDSKEYQKFKRKILTFKKNVFNNEKVILHSTELNRPTKTKQQELGFLTNSEARTIFYSKLNELLKTSNFEIIAYAIDKNKFNKAFRSLSIDIYFLSFSSIFKRFETSLRHREHGKVFIESRNRSLDKQFIITWKNARITKRYKALEPQILLKSWKHAGLELADLISYRISRDLFKKAAKPIGNEIDLDIIIKKKNSIEKFTTS